MGMRPILGIFGAPHKRTSLQTFSAMPELPEVEVTRRGLAPQLAGRSDLRLSKCVSRGCAGRCRKPSASRSPAAPCARVRRRGKYLLVDCGDGHLILHLGMSGSLRVLPPGTPAGKHDHFDLVLGDRVLRAARSAPLRRGAVDREAVDAHPLLAAPGRRAAVAGAQRARGCMQLTRAHRTAIKQFLMDGRRIVGVGNIYASESLFRAGINPRKPAKRLTVEQAHEARRARSRTRCARRSRPAARRCAISSARTAAPATSQQRHWVYDRAGKPCRRCRTPIRKHRAGAALDLLLPDLPEV